MSNRPHTFLKYMTAEVANIVLVSNKLRWSSPLLFNDPFDVPRDFNLGFDTEELKQPLIDEMMSLVSAELLPDISDNPLFEWLIRSLRKECEIRKTIFKELPALNR